MEEEKSLMQQIIDEHDANKLEDLSNLFEMNMRKKRYARMERVSEMLETADNELATRLMTEGETFNNDQLVKVLGTLQQSLSAMYKDGSDAPTIQINTQTNNIGVNNNMELNRESRRKVMDAVMAILKESTGETENEEGLKSIYSDSTETDD